MDTIIWGQIVAGFDFLIALFDSDTVIWGN